MSATTDNLPDDIDALKALLTQRDEQLEEKIREKDARLKDQQVTIDSLEQ